MKKAIILTDGKAGHENQSRAFARALGLDWTVAEVQFKSPFHKILSYILDHFGVRTLSLFTFKSGVNPADAKDCALVIGTGSGVFYAAKALAKKLGNAKCGVVLYPRGYHLPSFDCILAPSFDNPAKRENIIEIPVNLVANDESFYSSGTEKFLERHKPSSKKAVSVIVGGPNKCSTMTAPWMRKELERIFSETPDCEHWVTTSRRTPKDVEKVVEDFPFDYALIYSKDHFNPIPAFVKLSSRLYVTAESTGMLSEACSFGTSEVHALDNLKSAKSKFRRFLESLVDGGYVGGVRKVDLGEQFAKASSLLGV